MGSTCPIGLRLKGGDSFWCTGKSETGREFESSVYGLNLVKGGLEEMQHPITRQVKQIVM